MANFTPVRDLLQTVIVAKRRASGKESSTFDPPCARRAGVQDGEEGKTADGCHRFERVMT
jgi:hypothetical protein